MAVFHLDRHCNRVKNDAANSQELKKSTNEGTCSLQRSDISSLKKLDPTGVLLSKTNLGDAAYILQDFKSHFSREEMSGNLTLRRYVTIIDT